MICGQGGDIMLLSGVPTSMARIWLTKFFFFFRQDLCWFVSKVSVCCKAQYFWFNRMSFVQLLKTNLHLICQTFTQSFGLFSMTCLLGFSNHPFSKCYGIREMVGSPVKTTDWWTFGIRKRVVGASPCTLSPSTWRVK